MFFRFSSFEMNPRYSVGCELPELRRRYENDPLKQLSNVDAQEANKEGFNKSFARALEHESMTVLNAKKRRRTKERMTPIETVKKRITNELEGAAVDLGFKEGYKERMTPIETVKKRITNELEGAAVDLGFKEGYTIGGHEVDGKSTCILVLIILSIVCLCMIIMHFYYKDEFEASMLIVNTNHNSAQEL